MAPRVSITWRVHAPLLAKVKAAAHRRSLSVQAYASDALWRAVQSDLAPLDASDAIWLGEDLSRLEELPPFDWGPEGPPAAKPITYAPGFGFTIASRMP